MHVEDSVGCERIARFTLNCFLSNRAHTEPSLNYYTGKMGAALAIPCPSRPARGRSRPPKSAVISSSMVFLQHRPMLLRRTDADDAESPNGYNASQKVIYARKERKGFGEWRAATRRAIERLCLQRAPQTRMLSSRLVGSSDEQEVPAFLLHRVPPVDTLSNALCKVVVVDSPDFAQEFPHSSE